MYTNSLSSFVIIRIALPAILLAYNLIIPWLNNSNRASYCVAKIVFASKISFIRHFRISCELLHSQNFGPLLSPSS